jgi:sulfur carrier protein
VITIVVNGETHRLDTPLTFAALLGQLGLAGRRVALELNGRIVPRSEHAQTCVADGDRIEIVVAVGGG